MRYGIVARVYHIAFSSYLKKYYKEHFPFVEVDPILKVLKTEYKAMLKRTEGCGGNILENNLIGSCWFFSLAKCMPNMSPSLLNEISDSFLLSDKMMKMTKKVRTKGLLFSDKEMDKWERAAKASENSPYAFDWKFTFKRGKDEFFYTYTKCGVCHLAKQEHMEAYLPCMCHMDYAKFQSKGAKLIRTHTLAKGDDICDFHLVRIKE